MTRIDEMTFVAAGAAGAAGAACAAGTVGGFNGNDSAKGGVFLVSIGGKFFTISTSFNLQVSSSPSFDVDKADLPSSEDIDDFLLASICKDLKYSSSVLVIPSKEALRDTPSPTGLAKFLG